MQLTAHKGMNKKFANVYNLTSKEVGGYPYS